MGAAALVHRRCMVAQDNSRRNTEQTLTVDDLPAEAIHAFRTLHERGSPTIWPDLLAKLQSVDETGPGCVLAFNGEQFIVAKGIMVDTPRNAVSGTGTPS
jgi:hypothetical protein